MPRKRRTLFTTSCTLALVAGALPAVAQASRPPTAHERGAITRAAVNTAGSPTQRVVVSEIVVSTAGPWATATVSLYLKRATKKPEMVSEDTFYRLHGKWLDTANVSTPERTPPDAVVQDLGLPANPGKSTGPSTFAFIVAGIGLALAALAVLYLLGRLFGFGGGGGDRGRVLIAGPQPPGPFQPSQPVGSGPLRRKCSCDDGTRYCVQWGKCQPNGRWWEPDPDNPGRLKQVTCIACAGRGHWRCPDCRGTGWLQ